MSSEDRRPIVGEDEAVQRIPKFVPRPLPSPIPTPNIFDEPTVCLVINSEWASHFMGVFEALDQPDTWIGSDEEIESARHQIREAILMMMGNCMICCDEELALLTTMVTNLTTIVTNLTTVINQGDTNIEQNYDVLLSNYQQQIQNWTISNQTVNELNQMIYDGTPQSIAPNLGADFNTTGGNDALCAAIKRYVENIVSAYTANVNFAAAVAGLIGTAAAAVIIGATLGAAAPFVGAWGLIAGAAIGVPVATWNLVAASTEGKRKVECCMYDSLKDQAIDQAAFKAAVADCSFDPTTAEGRIAGLIHDWSQSDSEYLAFLRMLGQETGGNAGDCACDCSDDVVLEDFTPRGTVITPMGNCIYRCVQTTPNEAGHFWMSFRDIMNRCLLVENSPDPSMTTAGVGTFTTVVDCTDASSTFVGGFTGGTLKSVDWWQADTVNYFKVTLVP